VGTNNGTIINAIASNVNASSVFTNNGTVTNATGGSVSNANGVSANNGTVTNATGGSVSNANGVSANNGTVTNATGGSALGAFGVSANNGTCLRAFNNTGRAINSSRGDFKLVDGPNFRTTIDQTNDTITTIYTINGPLHSSAIIPAGVAVIDLSASGGSSRPVNPFTQQVIG